MRGLFFSGTDTGVGKTFVTAAVANILSGQKRSIAVCKPVATGAERINGCWRSQDTLRLARVCKTEDWDSITPWAFPDPVAPSVAIRREKAQLDLGDIVNAIEKASRGKDAILVEGVGGLLCPLVGNATVADLVKKVHLALVVVARRSLGTLNHTLMTLEVARIRELPVVGLIICETSKPETLAEETNVEELKRLIEVPLLAVVPYWEGNQESVPPALGAVDWWKLCEKEQTFPCT